jgi:hypothetical protein
MSANPVTQPAASQSDDLAQRLATKLEARAKREQEREQQVKARQLEALELEERYESELGPIKKYFDILETSDGPIVLKLGESVLFKTFKAKLASKPDASLEDMHAFVFPCVVHPSKDRFLEITGRFPGLLVICMSALLALYQGGELSTQGK